MAGGGGGEDGEPEFQVAPLIDVLLVMLIFFMSITTAQVLKIDNDITLPLARNGEKRDDKAAAGLINIGWKDDRPRYKLDDRLIENTDAETPTLEGSKTGIIEELKKRKGTNEKFRLLVRADKNVQVQYVRNALKWGGEAGISNIAFSGVNNEN
ncbi:MAG: biopolymer transporter ExbD [Puniceicoccales bacterium]|jgi:biopolymer transport protein ExbD|nr:biopolymer transporter ExbD [Puniceicoccales bacterium]